MVVKGKPRLTAKKKNVLRDTCVELASYLNQDLDPWDFEWLLELYLKDQGLDLGTSFDEVVELPGFRDFAKGKLASSQIAVDVSDPAYLLFDDAQLMPPDQWYVHFSPRSFSRFDRGVTLDSLALSTYLKKKVMVDCSFNLSPNEVGLFEVVWGFAIHAHLGINQEAVETSRKYGKNFVLFQTDFAVRAYHAGDEQWQIIFPLCTEYNVVSGHVHGDWFLDGYDRPFWFFSDVMKAVSLR